MSTAYIGSSNLTHQAQRTGLEWNVRVSGGRNRSVVEKMAAVFDSYWEGGDFNLFDAEEFVANTKRGTATQRTFLAPLDIRLYPFQERLLEQVAVSTARGRHANLLVAATGTGKTVMAAVHYARLAEKLERSRLLFVAHSKEILEQSLVTFRHAVRDGDFGELWVGGDTPSRWDHVFASIQSLSASGLNHLDPAHFDVVIVDEFHHGAAKSYERFLGFIKPTELLGLTATPERADGLDVLKWFGGRIAAELRLWDAIDQGWLVPFDYYGVHDNSDLTGITWKRGKGYDPDELTNVYTADNAWAKLVLAQLEKRVDDLADVKALGFCVSIAHAQFMAKVFDDHGVRAKAIWGSTPAKERKDALNELQRGDIKILFSVDLFNEGVDLPNVSTLLLLRPTESPVLFLQQLGRGLRKAEGKVSCTVLDFIGQHRREFRIHPKLQAFFGGSRKHIQRQVESDFPFLPTGCHMDLESKARDVVLQSIRNAVPSQWQAKVSELKSLAAEGVSSLADFLEHSGLDVEDIYRGNRSWSELREAAGLATLPSGSCEGTLRRACGRIDHVNDILRLNAYREFLSLDAPPTFTDLQSSDARHARMLVAQVCAQALRSDDSLKQGIELLWEHPQVRAELIELLSLLESRVDHLNVPLSSHPDVPLQIHGRYTRIEILAATDPRDRGKTQAWREGVYWLEAIDTDVMVFTLDKTSGQFSPTTRYRDYAISRNLIHWETQSMTRAESPTGLRYRNQAKKGTHVLLFARESSDDRAFWFLGGADFVKYEGEKPMAITWRLHHSLPGDLYAAFAAAVG
jgi:superfamily II DNA or RNA helicase